MNQVKREDPILKEICYTIGAFIGIIIFVVVVSKLSALCPGNPRTPIGRGVITEIREDTAYLSFSKWAPQIGVAIKGDTLRVGPGTTVWGMGARVGDSVLVSRDKNGVYYTKKIGK
ncbi:MAG: hypothetical protein HGA67_00530 [Candidatus Yonathbacteria bacterium]|nr:hypothetical protein [Candidatus Yonathbacteria bacterium]